MNILEELENLKKPVEEQKSDFHQMHPEVFKVALYRLGIDWGEYINEPRQYWDLILEELELESEKNKRP